MSNKGSMEALSAAEGNFDGEPSSALPLTAASDTNTRAESRRTEDEAVTLPIPSSGLLTSPTQVAGHNSTPTWFGGVSPTAESHFSLAPLLSHGVTSSAMSPSRQAAVCTSTDGAVLLSGSPRPWPTPLHVIREFGHMPSRACSSGGIPTPYGRRSSYDDVTLDGMMIITAAVQEDSEKPAADPACSECSNAPDQKTLGPEVQQELEDAGLQLTESAPAEQVFALSDDYDQPTCGESYTLQANGIGNSIVGDAQNILAEPDESDIMPAYDFGASVDKGNAATVEVSGGGGGGDCSGGFGGSEEADSPQWLTAEECAVSDAITQLQAVVSGLSEPYQRYIRERALELTRIIDENLQRQGLEPCTATGMGPSGMATPSNKAATAAAALVLAVAASGTRWPYSTPSGGEGGGAGGGAALHSGVEDGSSEAANGGGARWLFCAPDLIGQASLASGASVPYSRQAGSEVSGGVAGSQAQETSYGVAGTSGSCTLCFGSVLGNSQVRQADSAEQTSGAVSARGGAASQQGPCRIMPRSRSYSSNYAQQQSHRRLANLRATGGGAGAEPASAVSSACSSNPYLAGHQLAQPQDAPPSARPSTSRRGPPRPPPRGLGCGLGQPRKNLGDGSRQDSCLDVHNLPYMVMPYAELPTARNRDPGALFPGTAARRSRATGQQPDQQQPHDQGQGLLGLDDELLLQQQLLLPQQDVTSLRRAAGRSAAGNANAVIPRAGNTGDGGSGQATNGTAGRNGIRPATATPAGYQPPWQRPPPSGRGIGGHGSERQRANSAADNEAKTRKAPPRVMSARGAGGVPTQPLAGAISAGQRRAGVRRHTSQRSGSEFDDDVSGVASAREPTSSDACSSYQLLLRKSGAARNSQASVGKRPPGAAPNGVPPGAGALLPPAHGHHVRARPSAQCSSYPIAMSGELRMSSARDNRASGNDSAATAVSEHCPATPRPQRSSCGEGYKDVDVDIGDGTWDSVLRSEMPYQLVQAFPGVQRDDAGAAVASLERYLDWQPLHTALTLDELQALASRPGDSEPSGERDAALGRRRSRQQQQQRGRTSGGGGRAFTSMFELGNINGIPFDDDGEPATAFAIVSRRDTRDVTEELAAQSSMAATSSMGDLSSLLPAPAWHQGRNAGDPAAGSRTGATAAAVAAAAAGPRGPPLETSTSDVSGCSTQMWENNGGGGGSAAAPDQFSQSRQASAVGGRGGLGRDPTFGGAVDAPERAGSAAAQLRSVLASMGGLHVAAGSAQGRRWQLDPDHRLVLPDKEQIRAGSPMRPRYTGNSDSHTSRGAEPQQQKQLQQSRRREPATHRDACSARGTSKAARGPGMAAAGGASRNKGSSSKRSSGNLGGTARAGPGIRARSTPHARAAKALRTTRAQPAGGRPTAPLPPVPPAPLLHTRPATPVMPSSPPPPQQSQTPVQLQNQPLQGPAAPGARRWTKDDDNGSRTQGSAVTGSEADSSPSTPTRRRAHVHSPEDMPLSAVARHSCHPHLGIATDAAIRSTLESCGVPALPAAAVVAPPPLPVVAPPPGFGLGGVAVMPGLPAGLNPPIPSEAPAGWGSFGSPSQARKLRPGAAAAAASPRLRGISYAPVPSHRWAAGRMYTTTSVHTDGTTITVTSPGRGAWHHDCTPNILSPPRNYDRPWATPSRKATADASGEMLDSAGYPRSARLGSPRRRGTSNGDADECVLGSPTGGRRCSMTARAALGRGSPRQRQLVAGIDRARRGGALRASLAEAAGIGGCSTAGASCDAGPSTAPVDNPTGIGFSGAPCAIPEECSIDLPCNILTSGDAGLSAHLSAPCMAKAAMAIGGGHTGAQAPSHQGPGREDREEKHDTIAASGPASAVDGYMGPMPHIGMMPQLLVHGGGMAAGPDMAAAGPITAHGPGSRGAVVVAVGSAAGLHAAPEVKAEGVQTDALDTTTESGFTGLNRTARQSSDGSRSRGSPTTARTDGGRGYNMNSGRSGRPPTGAFRPSGSLRATPAGTGSAQLALLHQAAWPGLRDPRVVDALSTLEAGIAVLDPAPPPPPSSLGVHEPGEAVSGAGGSSAPNGCFGLFNRSAALASKAPAVLVQEPAGRRPVLMRVHVADGAVEMVLLRPRRGGLPHHHHHAGVGPGVMHGSHPSTAAAAPAAAGEQRVRVAALSGLHPPVQGGALTSSVGAASAAGGLEDDVADPASRWVQLVAMDGGLMRLSACSPADHARLVLGLNAGLLAAMGAIGEETPLAVVPLSRGLTGAA